jgi:hypothetical protein
MRANNFSPQNIQHVTKSYSLIAQFPAVFCLGKVEGWNQQRTICHEVLHWTSGFKNEDKHFVGKSEVKSRLEDLDVDGRY